MLINQVAAPIYYVSPTQISVVVPYLTIPNSVAQIQVINNGANSNIVTEFTGSTSVGVFTNNPEGGLGYAAALHPDNSVISTSSPAQIGETVAVFLAGMGVVRLPVADGTAAPHPPSITTATPLVFLLDQSGHYLQCTVAFSGLAPGFAGLYQINFTVPAGLAAGNAFLEIIGPDSDTFQALLPVSTHRGRTSRRLRKIGSRVDASAALAWHSPSRVGDWGPGTVSVMVRSAIYSGISTSQPNAVSAWPPIPNPQSQLAARIASILAEP